MSCWTRSLAKVNWWVLSKQEKEVAGARSRKCKLVLPLVFPGTTPVVIPLSFPLGYLTHIKREKIYSRARDVFRDSNFPSNSAPCHVSCHWGVAWSCCACCLFMLQLCYAWHPLTILKNCTCSFSGWFSSKLRSPRFFLCVTQGIGRFGVAQRVLVSRHAQKKMEHMLICPSHVMWSPGSRVSCKFAWEKWLLLMRQGCDRYEKNLYGAKITPHVCWSINRKYIWKNS